MPLRRFKTTSLHTLALSCAMIVTALATYACDDDSSVATVEICGDILVPDAIDTIRVSVLAEDRAPRQNGIVELLECPGEILRPLPQQVQVQRIDGAAWIVVEGLKDGATVATFERRAKMMEQDGPFVMGLTRDCLGIACPLGQTCVNSICEQAPFNTTGDICVGTDVPDDDDAMDVGADVPQAEDAGMDDDAVTEDDASAEPDVPSLCPPEPPGTGGELP